MPGGQTAVLEETPVANEAACIDGVIEGLEQAAQFAKENGLIFAETSAKRCGRGSRGARRDVTPHPADRVFA